MQKQAQNNVQRSTSNADMQTAYLLKTDAFKESRRNADWSETSPTWFDFETTKAHIAIIARPFQPRESFVLFPQRVTKQGDIYGRDVALR